MTVDNTTTSAAETTTTAAATTDAAVNDTTGTVATTDGEDLLGTPSDAAATTTDGKADDQPAADEGDDLLEGKIGEAEAAVTPPDDYDLTPPEGYELDAQMADAFKPVAKELNLSQEQAQGLVEKFGPKMFAQIGEKQATQWKALQKQWAGEAKSDPDFGGKNLEASLSNVAKARDYLGPEFAAAVKLLGGNNHPALLKGLAKVGLALGEDTPGFGKPHGSTKSTAQILYPNDQPKTKE
jgi:hypothetical protein